MRRRSGSDAKRAERLERVERIVERSRVSHDLLPVAVLGRSRSSRASRRSIAESRYASWIATTRSQAKTVSRSG